VLCGVFLLGQANSRCAGVVSKSFRAAVGPHLSHFWSWSGALRNESYDSGHNKQLYFYKLPATRVQVAKGPVFCLLRDALVQNRDSAKLPATISD